MLLFIFAWSLEILWFLSDLLLKPRKLSYKKGYQREVNCKKFNEEAYRNKVKEIFWLTSDYGYKIYCELIEADRKEEKKIAILCHGLGYASYGCFKYMELFLKLGFSVLMYDHRNHGKSGKATTSMGFYEKYDLDLVVDWCFERYGKDCRIVTHGESMGAATVLLQLGLNNRVKCAIADCAYSDLTTLLCHQLKQFYHLPCFLIPIESLITYIRTGFWFHQVSPIKVIEKTDTPVLFIHGKRDNFVPTDMSKKMYAAKKRNKAIYLVAKAKHADCISKKREDYERVVAGFLEKYFT